MIGDGEAVLAAHVLRLESELCEARSRIAHLESAMFEESYTRRLERSEAQKQLDVLAGAVAELLRIQAPVELPVVDSVPAAPTIDSQPYCEHIRARRAVDGGRVLRAIRGVA